MPWQKYLRSDCRPGRFKSHNNKIIHEGILTALADATNDLSMACDEQRTGQTGAATAPLPNITDL